MKAREEKGPAAGTCETLTDLVSNNKFSSHRIERLEDSDNPAGKTVWGERINFSQFNWLRKLGIDHRIIVDVDPLVVRGWLGIDGLFVLDPQGQRFLVFHQGDDFVFWQPRTGELSTLWGDPFALGEECLDDAVQTGELVLFTGPLEWLRHGCRGIVVLDWFRAYQHFAPLHHVSVPEVLLPRYQAAMSRSMPRVHPYSKLQMQK